MTTTIDDDLQKMFEKNVTRKLVFSAYKIFYKQSLCFYLFRVYRCLWSCKVERFSF